MNIRFLSRLMGIGCIVSFCIQAKAQDNEADQQVKQGIVLDARFSLCWAWFSEPFRATVSTTVGRHRMMAQAGWGIAGIGGRLLGVGYQYRLGDATRPQCLIDPYLGIVAYHDYVPKTHVFSNRPSNTLGIDCGGGLRLNLPYGAYLHAQAGFSIEKISVPAFQSFFEDRIWVKPTHSIGFGYYFQLRPYQGLRQRPDTLPAADLDPMRHGIAVQASRSTYFFDPPTIDYRLQYSYQWKPRWDAYAGLDAATTRWFFPSRAGRDSVQLLGGRLGMRFFPLGKQHRIACYADGSTGIMRLVKRHALQDTYNRKSLQLEMGCGVQARITPAIRANLAFFHRQYWTFPGSYFSRDRENGVVFGLGWQFGGH